MQRLSGLVSRDRERGASAVIVTLCLVVVAGFGALTVDLGMMWSYRKQLQNGADAGALAVAQACALPTSDPRYVSDCRLTDFAAPGSVASNFAERNADSVALGRVADLVPTGADRHVTVETRGERELWLARVLGVSSATISTRATASWGGAPTSLTTPPIAVSACQFKWQTGFESGDPPPGTPVVIKLKSKINNTSSVDPANTSLPCVDNPAHNELPGGFGWLMSDADCSVDTSTGWVTVNTGASGADVCTATQLRQIFGTSPGKIVPLPLFDLYRKKDPPTIPNDQYKISGYAAIKITAYCFVVAGPNITMPSSTPCNGDSQRIEGTFVKFGTLDDLVFDDGGVNYGLVAVRLTD